MPINGSETADELPIATASKKKSCFVRETETDIGEALLHGPTVPAAAAVRTRALAQQAGM